MRTFECPNCGEKIALVVWVINTIIDIIKRICGEKFIDLLIEIVMSSYKHSKSAI